MSQSIFFLFVAVIIGYWQYGLWPCSRLQCGFYDTKNLGMIYGIVFLGLGLGSWTTKFGDYILNVTGNLNWAFWIAAAILLIGVLVSRVTKRPMHYWSNTLTKPLGAVICSH